MPIDYGWEDLETVEAVAAKFARHDAALEVNDVSYEERKLPRYWTALKQAYELAKGEGWEGDFRASGGPQVFFVPGIKNDMEYGFVWKQDNNGTTFIVAPYEFPWLEKIR